MDDNNKYPILRTGDRILSRRITGPIKYFSNCLAWFLHSNWSHVVPVIDSNVCLDILWPKSKIVSNSIFLSPDYKIMILRPRIEFTVEQNIKWIAAANLLSGEEYDLESFAGFLLDKPSIQNCSKINCSEGCLICDKSVGLLTNYDGHLVSPQTYEDFATAGMFDIIYQDDDIWK